jgi:NADPH-dependent ferric siderophore reductase
MASLPPTDTSSLLARLPGVSAANLELARREQISPAMVEVRLAGDVAPLAPLPGNDVMLAVPVAGGDGSFRRRYSVRSFDAAAGWLSLWIDTSAGGPGATWATSAPIGSRIELVGPRGKVTLDPMADWHLFIGDLSFLSAAYNLAEAIEPPGQAIFLFEVEDRSDVPVPVLDEGIGVTLGVIERDGRGLDDPAGLLAGLASLELPEDEGHVYVGGELSVVAAVRRALLDLGFDAEQLGTKPYWRLGVSNLAHGEPDKS